LPRTKENKQAIVADLKQLLSESQMAVVIEYKGLSVAEITICGEVYGKPERFARSPKIP